MTAPAPLPDDLAAALPALAAQARAGDALVALDFDGVLAPLRDDPTASRPLPEAAAALARLADLGVPLAVVSGRALDNLAPRVAAPRGTHLVGGHGAERGHVGPDGYEREPFVLPPEAAATLAALDADLERLVAGTTARIERKPSSVVLHTRTATREDAARLTPAAVELGHRAGADVLEGKDVVELSVLDVSKGRALRDLRAETGVRTVLYVGDDVTDERAFAALEPHDVTVKVGPGATAARFRVPDPAAVAHLLRTLAHLADDAR